MDIQAKIKQWLKDYDKTQPGNLTIDEDSFEGSAYYLLTQAQDEIETLKKDNNRLDKAGFEAMGTIVALTREIKALKEQRHRRNKTTDNLRAEIAQLKERIADYLELYPDLDRG